MTSSQTLIFTSPRQVEIRETALPAPGPGEVLIQTIVSAISPGTELLVYRGQCPVLSDDNDSISSQVTYPTAYGYACVGKIIETGQLVNRELKNRLVFAFQPHTTHFILQPSAFILLPAGLSPETACFLPNTETAVNLVQDAAPLLGERVLVLGQGIIGLLVTALLREFPLETLLTADFFPARRAASQALGIEHCLDAGLPNLDAALRQMLPSGADLTLEVSGSPLALDTAIQQTAYSGRIVIGSWYGEKKAALDLGGRFHRSRIKLIASQVSTISPELSGRWDKARRFDVAWNALARIRPEKWITHRFPLEKAADAYRLLDQNPQDAIQVIFDYDH